MRWIKRDREVSDERAMREKKKKKKNG